MLIKEDREYITKKLAFYEANINLNNKQGFYDFAKDCENIFCEIFNIMYDTDYKNLNFQNCSSTYPAIDLEDKERGWCIQVTSRTDSGKIKKTLKTFNDKKFKNKYSRLDVFVLNSKIPKRIGGVDRVFGFSELINDMGNLDEQRIEKIIKVLDKWLNLESTLGLQIEAEGEKGVNYLRYIEWMLKDYSDNEIVIELKNSIDYFYEELNRISKEARELIYIVSTKCPLQKNERTFKTVCFNGNSLFGLYSNKKQKRIIEQLLSTLDSAGHYREFEDGWGYRLCEFTFPCSKDSYDYDILYSFIEYCGDNNMDLHKLVVDIEFSLLDR